MQSKTSQTAMTYNLVKSPIYFKSDSPRCIDLIFANRKCNFKNNITAESGLSDFYAMIIRVVKGGYRKRGPRIIQCRDYSNLSIINHAILNSSIKMDYDGLDRAITKALNNYAPIKKKYVNANDGPFMRKELQKAIMHRSKSLNKCRKNKTNENLTSYKCQRNKCTKSYEWQS